MICMLCGISKADDLKISKGLLNRFIETDNVLYLKERKVKLVSNEKRLRCFINCN